MTPAARLAAAIQVLEAIEIERRPADQVAAAYFKGRRYIGAKDRRAVAETVWRVARRRARLDWWLEHVASTVRGPRARVLADLVIAGCRPGTDMFEGVHASLPPDIEERQMMDRVADQARGDLFHRDMPDWVRGEYPPWLRERLAALFGADLPRQMGAMRDEAPPDLRVNALKATRDEAVAALAKEGIAARPTVLSPLGLRLDRRVALSALDSYRQGLVEVQDEGSQVVALLVGAAPGTAVVDYCAGAGGKTLALAAGMANRGRLVACDVAEWRVDKAGPRLRRAGVQNVTRRVISGESDKWIKRNAGGFDRVLVDAPCSGTGTWRRNPDAKWQTDETTIAELVARQKAILASAARLVKPGGRLVYATCSLLPEENEDRVEDFLATHGQFRTVPVTEVWPDLLGTSCPVAGPYLRLTPLEHGTDGFFAAILERAPSS